MLLGLGMAVVSVHAACYAPTQIELTITSNLPCDELAATGGAEIAVAATASALASQQPTATAPGCVGTAGGASVASLGTLVLVPRGGRSDAVAVQVVVRLPQRTAPCRPPQDVDGCIVVRRSVRFIAHRSLSMPINLDSRCASVACGVDETCDQGRCVVADVGDCSGDCAPGVVPPGTPAPPPPLEPLDATADAPLFTIDGAPDQGPVTPPSRDAASDPDTGVCPPVTLHTCAQCGVERCCVVELGGVACGPTCGTMGNDQVCTSDCQCGLQKCSVGPACSGFKFCGGSCAPLE